MPRGRKDGSTIKVSAVFDERDHVTRAEHIVVRKRYTDLKGRPREKKRIAHSPAEVLTLKREILREIEAELACIPRAHAQAFNDLVEFCRSDQGQPEHFVAAMLLALKDALERNHQFLPELYLIDLRFFCNPQHFRPVAYVKAFLGVFEEGLERLARFSYAPSSVDAELIDVE